MSGDVESAGDEGEKRESYSVRIKRANSMTKDSGISPSEPCAAVYPLFWGRGKVKMRQKDFNDKL